MERMCMETPHNREVLCVGGMVAICSGSPPLPGAGILTPEEHNGHEETMLASPFVQLLLSVLTELIPTVMVNFMCQFGWPKGCPERE